MAAFVDIGLPAVKPIFDRVVALIQPALRTPDKKPLLLAHVHTLWADLKVCNEEYYTRSKDLDSVVGKFVRGHAGDFAEYFGREDSPDFVSQ
jgi:hypothetical protein